MPDDIIFNPELPLFEIVRGKLDESVGIVAEPPATCNFEEGAVFPMPTLPVEVMRIRSALLPPLALVAN